MVPVTIAQLTKFGYMFIDISYKALYNKNNNKAKKHVQDIKQNNLV